jgi:hypothetical protein
VFLGQGDLVALHIELHGGLCAAGAKIHEIALLNDAALFFEKDTQIAMLDRIDQYLAYARTQRI